MSGRAGARRPATREPLGDHGGPSPGAVRPNGARRARQPATGAAVVDFVLVAGMLVALFLGVVQFALLVYVRDVLVADAAAGARVGAEEGASLAAAVAQARQLVGQTLPGGLTRALSYSAVWQRGPDGLDLVAVRIFGPVPLSILPVGSLQVSAVGHAVAEPAPG